MSNNLNDSTINSLITSINSIQSYNSELTKFLSNVRGDVSITSNKLRDLELIVERLKTIEEIKSSDTSDKDINIFELRTAIKQLNEKTADINISLQSVMDSVEMTEDQIAKITNTLEKIDKHTTSLSKSIDILFTNIRKGDERFDEINSYITSMKHTYKFIVGLLGLTISIAVLYGTIISIN